MTLFRAFVFITIGEFSSAELSPWQLNDRVCERVKYHVSELAIERERKTGESSQCFSMPM